MVNKPFIFGIATPGGQYNKTSFGQKELIEIEKRRVVIPKKWSFEKTPFSAGQDVKTGHKSILSIANKHPHTSSRNPRIPGSAPLLHPDVRVFYIRVSSGFPNCFWQKKSWS